MNDYIPNSNEIFLYEYKISCFIKNVIKASNIIVGGYTYYDDIEDSTKLEQDNVLFNYPEFGDKLIIGKFCSIASKTKFIMGPANHRISSVTTYPPFNVFGGLWNKNTPEHLSQLPFKRDSVIMPGVKIGDRAIIGAYSVVTKDIEPYSVVGENPAKFIKKTF